jgi:Rhodopirellula transposase DDE domain
MAILEADEPALAAKFAVMRPFLDERAWRVYLGTEADALGYGGIAAVARASGASETTVAAGLAEARDPAARAVLAPGRSRRPGAGRPKAENGQPGLKEALDGLLEEGRRGDPMSAVTWNILSLRDIARQMTLRGLACSKDVIARMMHADGYSLQGMSRVLDGRQHEDRDLQFGNINAEIARALEEDEPVVSVDGKKKEPLGAYGRDGQTWQPGGDPVKVLSHDFKTRDTVTICPYGIYDIAVNRGFVSIGTSCDTAAFAVNAIRRWWQEEGQSRYPRATRLLVTCDAGGANDWRSHLWKDQLALLAEQTGLRIQVMHFPPGTSKWNKIEHRLFCHITRTWRARPLMTVADAVAGIAATVTSQGLKCTAVLDDGHYPKGLKVPPARIKELEQRHLDRDPFHGEWNYALLPVPRPVPDQEPEPERPARVPPEILNHPALTGMDPGDLTALAAALQTRHSAHREQRNYMTRARKHGTGERRRAISNDGRPNASARLTVTDYLLALRLRDHLGLPAQAIASLLGIDRSTVSHSAADAARYLAAARITPAVQPPPPSPPRTPAGLIAYAAANSIPLTIPENGQPMPERFRTRKPSPPATRSKPPSK